MQAEIPPKQTESLEDILHHYLTLHERWSEERQILAKQNAELGKLVTRLSAQIEKLKESELELKKQISQSIINSAHHMAQEASEKFKKESMQDVQASTQELRRVSENTTHYLREVQQSQSTSTIYFVIGLFLLPIIASLLIFWWLSPKPLLPMTDQQFTTYQEGKMLENLWPKLTKKQKEFLTKLDEGKINNHGKTLQEMQDPNVDNNNDSNNNDNENYTGN